jgi:hypothetical protein
VNSFAGMRVLVARPIKKTLRRTWQERLFSRPWRPFQATQDIIVPPSIGPDEGFLIGNVLHLR